MCLSNKVSTKAKKLYQVEEDKRQTAVANLSRRKHNLSPAKSILGVMADKKKPCDAKAWLLSVGIVPLITTTKGIERSYGQSPALPPWHPCC